MINKNTKFTFGYYNGQTFDQVASTEKGLLYLDKMVDWLKEKGMHITDPRFYNDLCEYVQQPKIAREIEIIINKEEEKEEYIKKFWK